MNLQPSPDQAYVYLLIGKANHCMDVRVGLIFMLTLGNPKVNFFEKKSYLMNTVNFHVNNGKLLIFMYFILIFTECTRNQEFSRKYLLLSHQCLTIVGMYREALSILSMKFNILHLFVSGSMRELDTCCTLLTRSWQRFHVLY